MGLLDDSQVQQIDAYQWGSTPAQSTGYDASKITNTPTVDSQSWDANKFDMTTMDSTGRNGVVEDRLGGLLDKGSKLQTLARTGAQQVANSRGLMNSSIAAGAGEKAAIESALPIASQDATAYNQIGLANQASMNRADSENTQARNNALTFDATVKNQALQSNQSAENQAGQFEAGAANNFAIQNKAALDQSARDFALAKNDASLANAGNALKALIAGAEESLSQATTVNQRKNALDGIASSLVQAGLREGIFANQDSAANWISMIGDMFPEMGLAVIDQQAANASASVV